MTEPKWKRFEKLIHQIHAQFGKDTVTLDEKLMGHDSKTLRQIDVAIRGVINQYQILIVVECKDEARPIDVSTMEAFAGVLRDVKANKGVMISTSGFTAAAIEVARTHGITTRTYLDTESVDWKKEVTIPVLLSYMKIEGIGTQFSSVPFQPMVLPTNIHPALVEAFSVDGTPLGPIITLLGRRWNHDMTLHKPGDHSFVLADDVLLESAQGRHHHARITITLQVREHHYLGPLSIKMVGFRDEQDGSITAQELKTDFIDPDRIMSGELPGWREIQAEEGSKIECFLRFGLSQALPESAEELKGKQVPKSGPGSNSKAPSSTE
jgi:Restriction endonuclease